MLADQRLGHVQCVDQFVHAALRFTQLQHDGDPHRCGQRTQQLAGSVQDLPRRWCGERGAFGEPIRGMLVTAYFVGTHIFVGGGRR